MTDVREITFKALMRDNSVISASVMPSAKYSRALSPDRFSSGSTASDSMRGCVPSPAIENGIDELGALVLRKGPVPSRHLIDHGAQCVEVAASIAGLVA